MRLAFPIVFLSVLVSTPAHALLCSVSASDLVYGSVDVLSAGATDGSANVSISCTGVPLSTVRLCLNLNNGSGGADGSGRYMLNGASTLRYQLYRDPGRTLVWGSTSWGLGGLPRLVDVSLDILGNGNGSVPIYGRVFGGQSTLPAGTYQSVFSGAQLSLPYLVISLYDCTNILSGSPLFATTLFTVSATVVNNCLVAAQNVDFGSQGPLLSNVDAAGQVSVTCTPGTNYTIGLNNGLTGSVPASRKMVRLTESITYGLYRDTSRTTVWGSSAGIDTVAGTGDGYSQDYSVYGRVPPQPTPSAGTYVDTVTVTVSY